MTGTLIHRSINVLDTENTGITDQVSFKSSVIGFYIGKKTNSK